MVWKSLGFSDFWVAGSFTPVRSLLVSDSFGQFRRYRIFTEGGLPAWARLAKDGSGKIGAFITGAYSSFVKVGSAKKIQPYLFVPLSSLSKRVLRKLLIPLDFELYEEDNIVVAREIENQPYYVANRNSHLFHHPGCKRAKRITSQNQIIFKTRQEALTSGYSPGRICRP
jgi:hypothetical protein